MSNKNKNHTLEKSKKKTYSFNLSIDNINQFTDKIGLAPRSKVVDILISNFVNNKKSLPLNTGQTQVKTSNGTRLKDFE